MSSDQDRESDNSSSDELAKDEPLESVRKKRRGRPPKTEGPAFPSDELERILVHGEAQPGAGPDDSEYHYPSFRELAQRFGVAHSAIAAFSKRHNCLERRKRIATAAKARSDEQVIEHKAAIITRAAVDELRTMDLFLSRIEQMLHEGRMPSMADYDRMVRLKMHILGQAESRHEVVSGGVLTLEKLQEYYAWRREEDAKLTPQSTGLFLVEPEDEDAEILDREDNSAAHVPVADPADSADADADAEAEATTTKRPR